MHGLCRGERGNYQDVAGAQCRDMDGLSSHCAYIYVLPGALRMVEHGLAQRGCKVLARRFGDQRRDAEQCTVQASGERSRRQPEHRAQRVLGHGKA